MKISNWVINLKRRPDRLKAFQDRFTHAFTGTNCNVFEAIDGKTLKLTPQIEALFNGNDFNYRAGVVACALSHVQLWQKLLQDKDADAYIIFEDDCYFTDDFSKKIIPILQMLPFQEGAGPQFHLFYLGGMVCELPWNGVIGPVLKNCGNGTFSYLISKAGAHALLTAAQQKHITRALDWFMIDQFKNLSVLTPAEPLCSSPINYDSDIQLIDDSLTGKASEGSLEVARGISFRDAPTETIRVYPTCNWATSEELLSQWKKMSKDGKGGWGRIQLTAEEHDIDFIAGINVIEPRFITKKTVLFQMEPSEGRRTWRHWNHPTPESFLKVSSHLETEFNNAEWHISKSYLELKSESIEKTKLISSVTSGMYFLSGHKKRVDFLKYLDDEGFKFDLYGKANPFKIKNYKGALPALTKDEGLFPYKYTIACENTFEAGYVTEKLFDAILSECLCFYWGCPNLEKILPSESFIRIPIDNKPEAKRIIEEAIQNNEWGKRIEAIQKAKNIILDEMNFFAVLERLLG